MYERFHGSPYTLPAMLLCLIALIFIVRWAERHISPQKLMKPLCVLGLMMIAIGLALPDYNSFNPHLLRWIPFCMVGGWIFSKGVFICPSANR